jgi:hypothetical protein
LKPSSKHDIKQLLLEIHAGIPGLNVEESFRHILLEDIELAITCFKEKNILSVLNSLAVLAGKLQTYVIFSRCHHLEIKKLLVTIHCLQQILIRLPICIIGPMGPTGPMGPMGPVGPKGPTGATGSTCLPGLVEPIEQAGTAMTISSSYPVSRFEIPEKAPIKPVSIDYNTYVVTYCNPFQKKQKN